ncbi:MAG: DUF72 domain-containing protein [Fervidicoccaceae archaeon]
MDRTQKSNRPDIGVCGFPKAMASVFLQVDIVELQQTFYDLLSKRRIMSIKKAKPEEKKISMKVWQVVTHPPESPTWKKIKKLPEDGERSNYGYLKPTEENFTALKLSLFQAKELGAFAAILQTPPSMPYNLGHLENITEFFRNALSMFSREGILLVWEPRGAYAEDVRFLEKISDLGVVICSDVLKRGMLVENDVIYTRLHGLGEKEVNYAYKYTNEDLERLKRIVLKYLENGKKVYVLFNNVYMLDDAVRFKKLFGE